MSKELHYLIVASKIKKLTGGHLVEVKLPIELWTEDDEKINATLLLTKIPGRVCATLRAEDGSAVGRTFQLTSTMPFYDVWAPLHEWLNHKLKAYSWLFVETPEYANEPLPILI